MIIRKAQRADIPQIMWIYNYEVLNSTATFDLEPKSIEERTEWYDKHNEKHPILVCEIDGKIAAYASLSEYRTKEAYSGTAELSIYVHKDYRNQGIGKAMMEEMIKLGKNIESLHTIVSVITGGNEISNRLHLSLGFDFCGKVREAGCKFGKYLDIDTYQIMV